MHALRCAIVERMALTITEFARMGGKARAKKLGKKKLQESARKAARARWARKKTGKPDVRTP